MTRQGKFKIQGLIVPEMPEKKVSNRTKLRLYTTSKLEKKKKEET